MEKDDEISGSGNAYSFEFRENTTRLGRFWNTDPLAPAYTGWSPYAFAQNDPVAGIDLEGLEFFYAADGKLLGQGADKDNKTVYTTTQDVVTTNTEGGVTDWTKVQAAEGTVDFTAKTGANNDLLVAFAAVIDKESSGSKDESYAIGNTTMNFIKNGGSKELKTLDDVVLYDNSFAQGATQENYTNFIGKTSEQQNSKYALGAAINALGYNKNLTGYSDYSGGATGWDGIDLVDTKFSNAHRGYKWSEASKSMVEKYKKDNNGGVDVSKWTYVKSGYDISATKIIGKSLYQKLEGGRGEKKQNATKFK